MLMASFALDPGLENAWNPNLTMPSKSNLSKTEDWALLKLLPATSTANVQHRTRFAGWSSRHSKLEVKSTFLVVTTSNVEIHAVYDLRGSTVFVNESVLQLVLLPGNRELEFKFGSKALCAAFGNALEFNAIEPCLNDFVSVAELGRGHFGRCILVRHRSTNTPLALKEIALSHRNRPQRAFAERVLLESVKSCFACRLCFAFVERGRLYLAQEFAPGGDLFARVQSQSGRRFAEETVRFVTAEIVLGLADLHRVGIVHRDIKPENVMLSQGHVKLIDFGLSKRLKKSAARLGDEAEPPVFCRTYSRVGTSYYMPPEMLRGYGHALSADWWQLGCLVFELLSGRPAFYARGNAAIQARILAGNAAVGWEKLENAGASVAARDFIRSLPVTCGYEGILTH